MKHADLQKRPSHYEFILHTLCKKKVHKTRNITFFPTAIFERLLRMEPQNLTHSSKERMTELILAHVQIRTTANYLQSEEISCTNRKQSKRHNVNVTS
jgi:Na+/phosphate symporter